MLHPYMQTLKDCLAPHGQLVLVVAQDPSEGRPFLVASVPFPALLLWSKCFFCANTVAFHKICVAWRILPPPYTIRVKKSPVFLNSCAKYSGLLSNISSVVQNILRREVAKSNFSRMHLLIVSVLMLIFITSLSNSYLLLRQLQWYLSAYFLSYFISVTFIYMYIFIYFLSFSMSFSYIILYLLLQQLQWSLTANISFLFLFYFIAVTF